MKLFSSLFLIFALTIPSVLLSQNVDNSYVIKVINEIASDKYEGRETGFPGCTKAEEYFVQEFRKLRLSPAGDSGTYFHHYTIPVSESSVKAALKIDERTFYQGYNEDFSVVYRSSWGEAEGEIVFAGYGIYNPEKNRNDFDSLDIKNKIVLIKRGAPRNDMASWMPSCIDSIKAEYCFRNGARGVLFFEPLLRTNQRVLRQSYGNYLAMVAVLKDFPVFSVDERVVRYIFSNAGQSYYRTISMIEMQPSSFATGRNCIMSAKGKNPEPINARNVLGMIPGNDRTLKNEYIIIGGHLDHVGMDENGRIWNGADDNASGVAVMLGIARAMKDHNFKPKRSIVFAAWTGEEMGLLGSKAWCERPTVDLSKTLVYFNLDMVALGNGKLNMPGIGYAPEITEFIKNNIDTTLLADVIWSEGGPGGSDHNNFLNAGIPAFAGMTAGTHPDYHQPGDDPEKVDPAILQYTGDFIYECSQKLANTNDVLLSAKRFDDNRLKLFSFAFFNPVSSSEYTALLKDRNFKLGIVKFACSDKGGDANQNFIQLIYALDSVLNRNPNKYMMATSAYDAMMSRSGLLAAFYPDAVGNDELKIKVLSRLGYRFAILDKNSFAYSDTLIMQNIIKTTRQYGIGLILDGLDSTHLKTITMNLSDPCLIVNSGDQDLTNEIIRNIIVNGHIIVFSPHLSRGMESDYAAFMKLQEIAGINNIVLSPSGFDDESLKYLQKFVKQIDMRTLDKDARYKIMGDNFYNIAVKSLQAD
ncbi:MAG TPA: M20/M25/M40 family metallo-hydrolase [Bacteroidales bacterium]|jgi:hypothetical protein|nr:M20/M25/M40 family metallo-hydrolase [Bacteroidales bacterium]